MEEKVIFLGGGWNCFSNLSSYMVEINGILFPTSEHAYQWAKFDDEKIKQEILLARSGYDAKMIAVKFKDKVVDNWRSCSVDVMESILIEKLAQHPHIEKKLLDTKDMEIIENSKDDYFWGIGQDGTGQNMHGKIWMKLRGEIRKVKTN
jgi:ribA/ribD-fused uncharacterized protein